LWHSDNRYTPSGGVFKRSRTPDTECPEHQYDCADVVERTIWDGDQILWEVRVADRDFQENDAPQGPRAGRVGYTHGPGIDAPLSFVRAGLDADPPHTVIVHLSWRGMPDGGTFPDGSTSRGSLDLARGLAADVKSGRAPAHRRAEHGRERAPAQALPLPLPSPAPRQTEPGRPRRRPYSSENGGYSSCRRRRYASTRVFHRSTPTLKSYSPRG
jgi:hypothetical protein